MAQFVEVETRDHDADIVVFPELATTGYLKPYLEDPAFTSGLYAQSEPVPGPTTEALGEVARRCGTHVIVGISRTHPKIPHVLYNSSILIGPGGEVIGVYDKLHAAIEEKQFYIAGNTTGVHETELGRIGMNICYDVRFPELARMQALQDADMIIAVWAMYEQPGKAPSDSIIIRSRMRAKENIVYFVGCNRSGREGDRVYFGRSIIAGPDGSVITMSNTDAEEVLRGTLTADELASERERRSYLNDRRPDLYGALVAAL
jgi:predicted amidohydrolase